MMDQDEGQLAETASIKVLHLEDSPLDADLTQARLRREGLSAVIRRVETREGFESVIQSSDHLDLILSDYRLPEFDGMSALQLARQYRSDVPFIFISGVLGEENAIDSLKLGATDYVLKQRMDRLVPSIRRAIAEYRERRRLREVEQALARSQNLLRFTLEAVRVGYWNLDIERSVLSGRSPFFDRIFGATDAAQSWTVDRVLEHVRESDRPTATVALGDAMREGGSCDFECRIVRGDGRERWIWMKGAHHAADKGGLGTATGIVMDVTERKLAEQERERLLRSEREARSDAERASRLKDDFLATLSHELRTPLNAVLGWTQLLRRGVLPPAEVPGTIEVIERNARLQAQLVEDLLDMSRITSGKLRVESEPTELAPVILAATAAIRPGAEAKRVTVVSRLPAESIFVIGDPSRLQQVFWNLLSNAVKFTPAGGTVQIALEAEGSCARVVVTDSGQGIDPSFLPNVFDRFRQQDSSIGRSHGGLGVGLSIVRHLVELHDGEVTASSDGVGKGATFTVQLPILPNETGATAQASRYNSVPQLAGNKVLIVEDEMDTREYFARILLDTGAEVLTASSAAEGYRLLLSQHPDLLLSDIGMPEQDGYAFIRKVRASGDGIAKIPAIALTAYARPEDRVRSLSAGFNDHLAKPVDALKLLERVGALITKPSCSSSST